MCDGDKLSFRHCVRIGSETRAIDQTVARPSFSGSARTVFGSRDSAGIFFGFVSYKIRLVYIASRFSASSSTYIIDLGLGLGYSAHSSETESVVGGNSQKVAAICGHI